MMDDKIVKLIESLGADGVQAFYIYLAVDTLQLVLAFIAVGWLSHKFMDFMNGL